MACCSIVQLRQGGRFRAVLWQWHKAPLWRLTNKAVRHSRTLCDARRSLKTKNTYHVRHILPSNCTEITLKSQINHEPRPQIASNWFWAPCCQGTHCCKKCFIYQAHFHAASQQILGLIKKLGEKKQQFFLGHWEWADKTKQLLQSQFQACIAGL